MNDNQFGEIINLNVGGTRFSTSRQTLTWIPDTFFTSLLSGRINTLVDDQGSIFVDRDPTLFMHVLNYLRTKEIHLPETENGMKGLVHEAEFYGITPLTQQLKLVQELEHSSCGNVLYYGCLNPPSVPFPDARSNRGGEASITTESLQQQANYTSRQSVVDLRALVPPRGTSSSRNGHIVMNRTHSRSSSLDLRWNSLRRQEAGTAAGSHNQLAAWFGGLHVRSSIDPLRVNLIKAHHNWILIAYAHMITCHKFKDAGGWQLVFTSPWMDNHIDRVALNARMTSSGGQNQTPNPSSETKMVALASGTTIRLWAVTDDGQRNDIGTFNMHVSIESLFFIGSQLVALSRPPVGKIGVWHSMTQHWQIQDVTPVSSYDTAGSLLLLGCSNGSICYIDMQKFPLRMKDNDLLVTELYRNPTPEAITSISVYLTPKTNHTGMCGNWIEIAYGTSSGAVRVIVQHPETVGHGPQLFQTFTVHRSPVNKVRLSEKYLVSVCSEYNHVRTWSVTRFRGMISTQPGSTPVSSFKVLSLDEYDGYSNGPSPSRSDCGPYGEQDDEQLFVQQIVPDSDELYVRLASTGKRVCVIKSVDGTIITSFCVHECEGSSRMGSRPRRVLFTGHSNGVVQIWDLSTALDLSNRGDPPQVGGPTPAELVRALEQCEVVASRGSTPAPTPNPGLSSAFLHGHSRIKAANVPLLLQLQRPNNDATHHDDTDAECRLDPSGDGDH
ncbi:hypothetical protein GHT06_008467 [Daphnia sinensis]|uniref:BTB domain-containing protein n=1 Tax=Daphnia sinensis TaxID=1820382 RepID=A0AAD5L1F3_9CRUS|nr:hypothetical protein GHT06_008467 [Daphnia sinensis]